MSYELIAQHSYKPETTLNQLKTLMELNESGNTIRKVEFEGMMYYLNRAADEVWKKVVCEQFCWNQKYKELSISGRKLHSDIMIMGLINIRAAGKKIIASKKSCYGWNKVDAEMITAMNSVIDEFMPIVDMVEKLKKSEKIVKGRKPAEPKPVDPNKDIKTCPCCFRQIAVIRGAGKMSGKMAHHGYERPGSGWQTDSCMGVDYQPLEISTDGLVAYISALKGQINLNKLGLKNLKKATVLIHRWRTVLNEKKKPVPLELVKGECDERFWNEAYESQKNEYESRIRMLKNDLEYRELVLKGWAPNRSVFDCAKEGTHKIVAL
jgi:hypothetical protein